MKNKQIRIPGQGRLLPLGNFIARIRKTIVGEDSKLTYLVVGSIPERHMPLPDIEVPADEFQSLLWVEKLWGPWAVVYPAGFRYKSAFIKSIFKISGMELGGGGLNE